MAAKRKFSWAKFFIIFFICVAVSGAIYYLFSREATPPANQTQMQTPEWTSVLVNVATWVPDAGWTEPAPSSETTMYGTLQGYATTGHVTSEQPSMDHFEMKPQLDQLGFTEDVNLAASGPGSDVWGYKKTVDGQEQVLIMSYTTQPSSSNPDEPLQFNCPCQIEVKAFVSEPFTPTPQTGNGY